MRIAIVLQAGLVLAACQGASGGAPITVFRDSAGVIVVENGSPALAPVWQIPDSPMVSLGGQPDDPGHGLFRVTGARRLPDGTLLVADGGSAQLRLFGADGTFLRAVGREGAGPGEFRRYVGLIPTVEDSIVTLDGMQRISVFSPTLEFVRETRLQRTPGRGFPSLWGRAVDGDFIALESAPDTTHALGDIFRATMPVARFHADGSFAGEVITLPGSERYRVEMTFGGRTSPAERPVELGRVSVISIQRDRLYAGLDNAFEMIVYDLAGRPTRIIRAAVAPDPVTEALREAQIDMQLEFARQSRQVSDEMRTELEGHARTARFSDRLPFYGAISIGEDGAIWVQRFQKPGETFYEYVVFDSTGAMMATAQLPVRARGFQFARDAVIARWTDEDDVEYVRVYPIRR